MSEHTVCIFGLMTEIWGKQMHASREPEITLPMSSVISYDTSRI